MVNLDLFMANVALPTIGRAFDGEGLANLSWVLNAYAIVFAALLVPAGRPGRPDGTAYRVPARRRHLRPGLGLVRGLGERLGLVAARVVQAAGGALMMPASLGLLLAVTPPAKRAAAIRGWTAIGGLAAALGPVLGGLLVEPSWHWVFLVNLPVAAVTVLAGWRAPPRGHAAAGEADPRSEPSPDILGAGLLTVAVGMLALSLVKADAWGWGSGRVIGLIAASIVALALFWWRSSRHPAPVIDASTCSGCPR